MAALLALLLAAAPLALAQNSSSGAGASSKRGLVYVTTDYPNDDNFWDSSTSDLTWYYNYAAAPTSAFTGKDLEFVPMLWGAPSNPTTDTTFYDDVKALISGGTNVTWVLGFNEPDGCDSGGSCVTAEVAAEVWIKQMEPLRALGIKVGAPAVTGATTGFTWLQNWMAACGALHSDGSGCEIDFIPIHWYGNFAGLASHLGQVEGTYSNVSDIWITEYAYADQDLADSQSFYNETAQYFDRLNYTTHYSYFGSFRSDVSNVGAYAAMLNQDGELTDIGSWYLGGNATGNNPDGTDDTTTGSQTTSSTGSSATSSTSGAADLPVALAGSLLAVITVVFWALL